MREWSTTSSDAPRSVTLTSRVSEICAESRAASIGKKAAASMLRSSGGRAGDRLLLFSDFLQLLFRALLALVNRFLASKGWPTP